MGFKDFMKKLVPKVGKEANEIDDEDEIIENTHNCALCQKDGADVKWMGQWWHKKCLRTAKKMAKKMI